MSCLPACGGAGRQLDAPAVTEIPFLDSGSGEYRGQLGDDAGAERLQHDYLTLLDQRVQEIAQAMRGGQIDECIAHLLTLETSSHMMGADELSLRAAALRLAVGHHQPDVGVLLSELTRAARSTTERLSTDPEGV